MAAFPGPYRVPYPYIPDQTEGARSQLARNYAEIEEWIKGLPWGVLGVATKTADQLGIGSTPTDITNLSTTVAVGANRRVKVTVHVLMQKVGGAGAVIGEIFEDAGAAGRFTTKGFVDGEYYTPTGSDTFTPTAGSHTYKAVLYRATGAGTIDILAAAGYKAWIMVEDIGPA